MKYIEALEEYNGNETSIFLAGGITGCSGWQDEIVKRLQDTELTVLNPRRKHFPMGDLDASLEQIAWEHRHLRKATMIAFWFPSETLCPIALYELGSWSMTNKKIFVGAHPDYKRKQDVEIQTKLARPDIKIVYSIDDLAGQIKAAKK